MPLASSAGGPRSATSVADLPRVFKDGSDAFTEGGLQSNAPVWTVTDSGALQRLEVQAGFGRVTGRTAMAPVIERAKGEPVPPGWASSRARSAPPQGADTRRCAIEQTAPAPRRRLRTTPLRAFEGKTS